MQPDAHSCFPGGIKSHGLYGRQGSLCGRGRAARHHHVSPLYVCPSHLPRAQEWQGLALDALAAWLGEDPARLEPRLAQRDAVQRFVALFAAAAAAGDSEALARLLDSFLRLLRRSPKITVRARARGALRGLARACSGDLR